MHRSVECPNLNPKLFSFVNEYSSRRIILICSNTRTLYIMLDNAIIIIFISEVTRFVLN